MHVPNCQHGINKINGMIIIKMVGTWHEYNNWQGVGIDLVRVAMVQVVIMLQVSCSTVTPSTRNSYGFPCVKIIHRNPIF